MCILKLHPSMGQYVVQDILVLSIASASSEGSV